MSVIEADDAREHHRRGDWSAAFAAWSAVGADCLDEDDLHRFATAASLLGRHDEAVVALQRVFVGRCAAGDLAAAVRCAFELSMETAGHGEPAMAAGWTARAEGLLAEIDGDCAERGWVSLLRMFRALGRGDLPEAAASADEAAAAGRRHHDPDLVATAVCSQGRLALYTGRVAEGLALLDEAMVRVISGETESPVVAGHVYCTAIEGCQEISDFARMAEWTSALQRWCAAQPGLIAFTGQCAVHRGQLFKLRGDWERALDELERATRRYEEAGTPDAVALAAREAGDVLRLRGDFEAADAAYRRAGDLGLDPQPGLALLWLAQGKVSAATDSVRQQLDSTPGAVQRLRVLPAAVEILLAAGEVDEARGAATELDALAAAYGGPSLLAAAALAAGSVDLAAGDAAGALPYLRKAQQLCARAEDRYGQACARMLAGRALAVSGDAASSRRELEAARSVFGDLRARPAVEAVDRALAGGHLPAGLTAREAEVLRLVATGMSNARIAEQLVLSEKTVARHLSNIFVKIEVGTRSAATAYAFEHQLVR